MSTARLAGGAMLLYYAAALTDMALFRRVAVGAGTPEKLASIAAHVAAVRLTIVLEVVTILCALALAATLYRLTRTVNADLSLVAFGCRVVEGVLNSVSPATRIGLLSIATKGPVADGVVQAQADMLARAGELVGPVSGTVFAVGSALFAYLLARGRQIPAVIAWTGLAGSLLVIPVYLLSGFRVIGGSTVWLVSLPLIAFELLLGGWLFVRGVQPITSGDK